MKPCGLLIRITETTPVCSRSCNSYLGIIIGEYKFTTNCSFLNRHDIYATRHYYKAINCLANLACNYAFINIYIGVGQTTMN